MKIGLLSDLHYEHWGQGPTSAYLKRIEGAYDFEGVDILVLAGDITTPSTGDSLRDRIRWFADRVADVVYVPGNHEYWGLDPATFAQVHLRPVGKLANVHVLDNRTATVQGVRFGGGTLWYPKPPAEFTSYRRFADFEQVTDHEPWVYAKHHDLVELLEQHLPELDVVVTHHLPAAACIAPRFLSPPFERWNHFFCTDLAPLIEARGPKLWLHGHTHHRTHARIGQTDIYANPLGYPSEAHDMARGGMRWPLTVEL